MDLAAAVKAIVDRLTAAGVRASADSRDLNLPGVLVQPPTLAYRFGKGGMTATWELWCLVIDSGRYQALQAVSELIDNTQEALGWSATGARPIDARMPDGTTPAGYILTFTETTR